MKNPIRLKEDLVPKYLKIKKKLEEKYGNNNVGFVHIPMSMNRLAVYIYETEYPYFYMSFYIEIYYDLYEERFGISEIFSFVYKKEDSMLKYIKYRNKPTDGYECCYSVSDVLNLVYSSYEKMDDIVDKIANSIFFDSIEELKLISGVDLGDEYIRNNLKIFIVISEKIRKLTYQGKSSTTMSFSIANEYKPNRDYRTDIFSLLIHELIKHPDISIKEINDSIIKYYIDYKEPLVFSKGIDELKIDE